MNKLNLNSTENSSETESGDSILVEVGVGGDAQIGPEVNDTELILVTLDRWWGWPLFKEYVMNRE